MRSQNRNGTLDFIKTVAAVCIAMHHYQQVTGVSFENGINFYGGYISWGYLVELFFIISGLLTYKYVAAISDRKISFVQWYKKKAIRLLPMTAISAAVYTLACNYYQKLRTVSRFYIFDKRITFKDFLVTALGLQDGYGFDVSRPNSPLWYISVFITCSVIFYLITRFATVLKIKPEVLYMAMVLVGVWVYSTQMNTFLATYNTSRGYYSFFTGVLMASAENAIKNNRKLMVLSCAVIAVFAVMLATKPPFLVPIANYILTFVLYPVIIVVAYNGKVAQLFAGRIWGELGAISFSIYIWHIPMLLISFIMCDMQIIELNFASVKTVAVYMIAVALVGVISWYGIEKPLNKLLFKNK